MSGVKWHWGTGCQEPILAASELPAERLVLWYDAKSKAEYWAAYRKHKQVNGGRLPADFDSVDSMHIIHTLQLVMGYGPLYWRHAETEYYKFNLFLIGYDEELLGPEHPATSYDFDPNDH